MSDSKTGSLIVMEKEMLLGDVIKTGTPVDAHVSHELIGNIFFPKSPLHDAPPLSGTADCSAPAACSR